MTISTNSQKYNIENATWKDLGPIREQEKLCFPQDSWPMLDLLGALSLPNFVSFKTIYNEKIIGFVIGEMKLNENTGWIASISVIPDHRGNGLAKKMLHKVEESMNLPEVRLTVRASNEVAIGLYLSEGYERIGRWRKYYRGKEDGVVMSKHFLHTHKIS